MSEDLILASASPRRQSLLAQVGIESLVMPVDIDESPIPGESALQTVVRLATEKAQAGWRMALEKEIDLPLLAADTVVIANDQALGKPEDQAHCVDMLTMLSNTEHQVATAFSIIAGGAQRTECVVSTVEFASISNAQAIAYWQSGEPADKAGGYAIQGYGARFVVSIRGSYPAIVGLPLFECLTVLKEMGVKL